MPPADPAETHPFRNEGPSPAFPSDTDKKQEATESHNFAQAPTKSFFTAKPRSSDPLAETELPGALNASDATSAELKLPCRFGDYDLLAELGKGGMGVVYKAKQRSANRLVALKLIRPDQLSRYLPEERLQVLARFRNEVQAAAQLEHDHVVTVYDVGEIEGQSYYAMRLVDGESLKDRLDDGPLEPEVAARYIEQVARALAEAHARGILHRDLKPHNVMLDVKTDRALLADFGLAKLGDGDQQLTASSSALGSPPYMSPEQTLDSGKVTTASDIYGLGATLYHLLTGRPPFQAANAMATMMQVQIKDPVSPRELNPAVPLDLETICLKCLEKEAEKRYASALDVADRLARVQRGEPIPERPIGRWERARRWGKRNRTIAALLATVMISLVAGLCATTALAALASRSAAAAKIAESKADQERTKAVTLATDKANLAAKETDARQRAQTAQKQAEEERAKAVKLANENAALAKAERDVREMAERHLYATHMNLAQAAWENARIRQTIQLLDLYRPGGARYNAANDLRGYEWYYWDRASHDYLDSLDEHSDWVRTVAISPDGRQLASGSRDRTVKIWDTATGKTKRTLRGHDNEVWCVAFSPDGQRLASGSADKTVILWDVNSGGQIRRLNGHSEIVQAVAFSPDGAQLASGSEDRTVQLWNVSDGKPLRTFEGHSHWIANVAFSPDGSRLASASHDGTIKIWNYKTGEVLFTMQGSSSNRGGAHTRQVQGLAFDTQGKHLASGCFDRTVAIWDADTGTRLQTLRGHTDVVLGVAFSPDAKFLASSSKDQTVRTWEVASGQELQTFRGHTSEVWNVVYSPFEQCLYSASWDKTIKCWNLAHGQGPLTFLEHKSDVRYVAYSPDGKWVATSSRDGLIRVWSPESGRELHQLRGHGGEVVCLDFSPNGSHLASASNDRTAKIWDLAAGRELFTLVHASEATSVRFDTDGQRLITSSADGSVLIWNTQTGNKLRPLAEATFPVSCTAFNPRRKLLALGGTGGEISLWNFDRFEKIRTIDAHSSSLQDLDFSEDGSRLASASADGTAKIWDATQGLELQTLKSHTEGVWGVSFSPDGQRVATSSWDNTVKVWDPAIGRETLTFTGHTWQVGKVAFSPDGKQLATASFDYTAKIWNGRPDSKQESRLNDFVERLAVTAFREHSGRAATLDELQDDLRADRSVSDPVRRKALALALASLGTAQPPPRRPAMSFDASRLSGLAPYELIYLRTDGAIAARRFDGGKESTFAATWLDMHRLIQKPHTPSVFVECKNRLFEFTPEQNKPRVIRQFPYLVRDVTVHPDNNRIAWVRANPHAILIEDQTDQSLTDVGFGYDPVWSADGGTLVYTGSNKEDGWFLGAYRVGTTRKLKVPVHPAVGLYPFPSPDGERIAFSMLGRDGTRQLGIVSLQAGETRQVTQKGDDNNMPVYSPDGQFLAFLRGKVPNIDLAIINIATGEETIVANDADHRRPVWRSLTPSADK